jgi:hypothetical protein
MPFSIDSTTAALTASCMPKSSQLTISTRASGAKPSSSLDSRSTVAQSARPTGYGKHDAFALILRDSGTFANTGPDQTIAATARIGFL